MSIKGSNTTADYTEWNEATNLVRKLYRDGDYLMSLFIAVAIFTGLRVRDLRTIKWKMLLNEEGEFTLQEQKTGKKRTIRVNKELKGHVENCYHVMNISDDNAFCFLSKKKRVISNQRLNVRLKEIRDKHNIRCKNISCHGLRKTFGRACYERSGEKAEMAIIQLMELFNHSSPSITKLYLGITQDELLSTYDMLRF